VSRRDEPIYRRRRRGAAVLGVVVVAAASAATEAALGDRRVGPGPAAIEELYLGTVPERALIGQRLMVRMSGSATPELLRQARGGEIGGVIAFPPTGQPTDELRREIERLREAARDGGQPPLLVSIDQEGGEVKRLPDGPPDRAPAQLAAPGDEQAAREAGRRTGRYLSRLGIDVDLAPVLDVPSSASSFMSQRSFGDDPRVVAANGSAFAAGLEAGGAIPTAKHFPGLGRAIANTDIEPSEIDANRRELDADLAPFREAIARGVPMVMVGHAVYTGVDPDVPAALSPAIVDGLLRSELEFGGVVISDDLGAGAVSAAASEREAPVAAARAGVDVLLLSGVEDGGPALEALRDAEREGELDRAELVESLRRILELKEISGSAHSSAS
jgi:beta-N-acetylhexosaminidase